MNKNGVDKSTPCEFMNSKPFIIGVGGAHSAVGKTTLAEAIIRYLASRKPPQPFRLRSTQPLIGAIKYTKTPLYASLIDDESIIGETGKDTSKLSGAGARKVLWIKSPQSDLEELVAVALSRLSDMDVIVIEGNSAIEFAKPDIVIFIIGEPENGIKHTAEGLMGRADIVIVPKMSQASPPGIGEYAKIYTPEKYPYKFDGAEIQDIITFMEDTANKKEIKRLLTERSVDARLTCNSARMIAEELDVPYIEVGKAANELKIKIKNCELGCF